MLFCFFYCNQIFNPYLSNNLCLHLYAEHAILNFNKEQKGCEDHERANQQRHPAKRMGSF